MSNDLTEGIEKQAVKGKELLTFGPSVLGGILAFLNGYKSAHPDLALTWWGAIPAMWNNGFSEQDIENAIGDTLLGAVIGAGAHGVGHVVGSKALRLSPKNLRRLPYFLMAGELGTAPLEPSGRHTFLKLEDFVDSVTNYTKLQAALLGKKNILAALGIGGAALALGGGGYALYKWLKDREEERASRTRMKMKISTPDGKDAIVDLPINNPDLSDKLSDEFNRGVTRSVRRTARFNSMKLDPQTNKYIPFPDWHKKYGDGQGAAAYTGQATGETGEEYTLKAANLTNMPAQNLVDGFAVPAKESGIALTRSDKVRLFLDALDIPLEQLDKMAKYVANDQLTALIIKEIFDDGTGKFLTSKQFAEEVKKRYALKYGAGTPNFSKKASELGDKLKSNLSEILGTVVSPMITGTAAGIMANKMFNVPESGSLLIGQAAAGLSNLIGAAAAGIAPSRTVLELLEHDAGSHALINALIPGAAMFNSVQRAKVIPDEPAQQQDRITQKEIVLNKPLETSNDFLDEEEGYNN